MDNALFNNNCWINSGKNGFHKIRFHRYQSFDEDNIAREIWVKVIGESICPAANTL